MDSPKPIIRIKNADYQYSEAHPVILSKINLEVIKGEFLVITGRSGSGKSTLALVLSGFIPHLFAGKFTGEIEYQGLKTEELSLGEISQFVGLVQQNPENQIVTSTVVEEITFGPGNLNLDKDEILKRLSYSIAATNSENISNRSTTALSGGEKQKVVLASILSMGSSVLILDEPFSFLDHQTRSLFLATLKELTEQQGKTIIVVDHQPEIYRSLMTRLIVLTDGTMIYGNDGKESKNFHVRDGKGIALAKVAGMRVFFVPACLVASYESTTWRQLFEFGRRQFLITRISAPRTWRFGLYSCLYSILGLWVGAGLAVYASAIGDKNLPFLNSSLNLSPGVFP